MGGASLSIYIRSVLSRWNISGSNHQVGHHSVFVVQVLSLLFLLENSDHKDASGKTDLGPCSLHVPIRFGCHSGTSEDSLAAPACGGGGGAKAARLQEKWSLFQKRGPFSLTEG